MSWFGNFWGRTMGIKMICLLLIRALLLPWLSLATENLALQRQVAVYKQSVKRPKLRPPRPGLFGWCSPGSGSTGNPHWPFSNPKRSSHDTDRDSDYTGDGSRGPGNHPRRAPRKRAVFLDHCMASEGVSRQERALGARQESMEGIVGGRRQSVPRSPLQNGSDTVKLRGPTN